jgi:predicted tellurium resistance membrane protein TerC
MYGIIGALAMRAAFIAAGITLLDAIHPVIYVFGAVLLLAAASMLRGGTQPAPAAAAPARLPVTGQLHGERFAVREGGPLPQSPACRSP